MRRRAWNRPLAVRVQCSARTVQCACSAVRVQCSARAVHMCLFLCSSATQVTPFIEFAMSAATQALRDARCSPAPTTRHDALYAERPGIKRGHVALIREA
jgi:hypothetical protein